MNRSGKIGVKKLELLIPAKISLLLRVEVGVSPALGQSSGYSSPKTLWLRRMGVSRWERLEEVLERSSTELRPPCGGYYPGEASRSPLCGGRPPQSRGASAEAASSNLSQTGHPFENLRAFLRQPSNPEANRVFGSSYALPSKHPKVAVKTPTSTHLNMRTYFCRN